MRSLDKQSNETKDCGIATLTSFPTAVKCGKRQGRQLAARVEREDNSNRFKTLDRKLALFFFLLGLFLRLRPLFFSLQFDTHLKLFFLISIKGRIARLTCSVLSRRFREANRSLIVKFCLGLVHHFLFFSVTNQKEIQGKLSYSFSYTVAKPVAASRRSSKSKKG